METKKEKERKKQGCKDDLENERKEKREREKKEVRLRTRLRSIVEKRTKSYGVHAGTKTKTMTESLSSTLPTTANFNNDHALYTTAKPKKKKKKRKKKYTPRTNGFGNSWKHRFLDTTATGSRCVSLSLTNLVLMVYTYIYISLYVWSTLDGIFVRFLAIYARIPTVCAHTYTHTHTHTEDKVKGHACQPLIQHPHVHTFIFHSSTSSPPSVRHLDVLRPGVGNVYARIEEMRFLHRSFDCSELTISEIERMLPAISFLFFFLWTFFHERN